MLEFGYRPGLLNTLGLKAALDNSRWIAALAVCSAHLRNLLFPDFAGGTIATKIFYFFTLFGTQSVVVFFVSSGLLVGGTILRAVNKGHFDSSGYLIDRASRLYVVLIPAIVLTEGLRLAGLTMTCAGPQGMTAVVINSLFLQNFIGSPLCNNHPLWSLSSEAFFYLIAPALLLAIMRRSVWAIVLTGLLFLIALYFSTASYMTPLFGLILWLIGIAPWFVSVRLPAWLGFLPFALFLGLSRAHHTVNQYVDALGLAITFSFFLCCAFQNRPVPMRGLAAFLAGFSYSLYLVHMPIAQAITAKLGHQLTPGAASSLGIYGGALALIIIAALLFGQLFENRTAAVRQWLRAGLLTPKA